MVLLHKYDQSYKLRDNPHINCSTFLIKWNYNFLSDRDIPCKSLCFIDKSLNIQIKIWTLTTISTIFWIHICIEASYMAFALEKLLILIFQQCSYFVNPIIRVLYNIIPEICNVKNNMGTLYQWKFNTSNIIIINSIQIKDTSRSTKYLTVSTQVMV